MPAILLLVLGLLSSAEAANPKAISRDGGRMAQAVLEYYGPGAAASALYVGTEACLACHSDYGDFRRSLHASGLKTATHDGYSMQVKDGVIADYDRNGVDDFKQGLDFNKIESAFNAFKPNAPVLGFSQEKGYFFRIGTMEHKVVLVHGGTGQYKQRYLVKLPVTDRPGGWSAGTYYSPIQFNEVSKSYVTYETARWWNANGSPRVTAPMTSAQAATTGKSFDRECSGCHATGLVVAKDPLGEFVAQAPPVVYADPNDPHYFDLNNATNKTAYNIGCERCHGPGGSHITNLGSKERIINPAKLTAKQANELCGSCHSRGTSKGTAMYEFPWNESANEGFAENIGDDLYGKYFVDKHGLWPDGKESRQHHQQFQDFMTSAKWEYPFHKVTCYECHDPHTGDAKNIRKKMVVDGTAGAKLEIATRVEDNSLCLACHAGFGPFATLARADIVNIQANRAKIAPVVAAHSKHPYEPEKLLGLSRCTECHMAKVASSGDPYDMSTHTFKVITPTQTLATADKGGMPNSCASSCHRALAEAHGLRRDSSLTNWTEPADLELARFLERYYGPEGIWWKTH
ncbi:MAG: hypothetical protein JNL62_06230 [Bryobacterales bacterium]|nr:hypothetical protein [Bryobacterales bacterium]